MESCGRLEIGQAARARATGRVTNPPQDSILPYSGCVMFKSHLVSGAILSRLDEKGIR